MATTDADGEQVIEDRLDIRAVQDTDVAVVVAYLGARESARGTPLVDESERERLSRVAEGQRPPRWHGLLATTDGRPIGYAGVVAPDGGLVEGDLVSPDDADGSPEGGAAVDRALIDAVWSVVDRAGNDGVRLWRRAVSDEVVRRTVELGFEVERRLLVLGRDLDELAEPDLPGGVAVRMYEPDVDDAEVVEVLREAYGGEEGWDLGAFRRRRAMPWFDPDDLLVAEGRNGDLAGIHWTKRRGGSLGEVYNLAIRPYAQGLGLGRALLCEGLLHLARVGCDEVILWVDAANGAAVDLYRSEGFGLRWQDVAFVARR